MRKASDIRTPESGFTLVEVLVSMFIFSLISVGAFIALSTTLDARERAQARIEQVEQLAAMHQLMKDDFAAMVIRKNRDGLGGFVDPLRQNTLEQGFELTRRGRPNPDGAFPRGDVLRVSWRVERGQLIRAFLPHENPAAIEPPIDRVILDGVESIQTEAFYGNEAARSPNRLSLPDLSIILTYSDGTTTRHLFELPDA